MIERDEAPVLKRSLESFKAIQGIDPSYCVVDGGSEDSSVDLIPAVMTGIPGEVHVVAQPKPLDDFATARNGAIDRARSLADWLFFLDADDEIVTAPGFVMPKLKGDGYKILIKFGDQEFYRISLVSTKRDWRFVGRMHEGLECKEPTKIHQLEGIWIQVHPGEGARSKDPKQKFLNDAAILRECLQEDPGNLRHLFYLAQSTRDAGALPAALDLYRDRAAHVEGWDEETYFSLFMVARILEWLEKPKNEVISAYLAAYKFRPSRAETLGCLAQYLRLVCKEYAESAMVAWMATQIPRPADILFVSPSWYEWQALDEHAVSSFWCGDYVSCKTACEDLLNGGKLPDHHRDRIQKNLEFALKALGR
jgi:hypothetical protein